MKLSEGSTISHYNRLDGAERILSDLYTQALHGADRDAHDPYIQGLLKAIVAVKAAQKQLDWSPAPPEDNSAILRQI